MVAAAADELRFSFETLQELTSKFLPADQGHVAVDHLQRIVEVVGARRCPVVLSRTNVPDSSFLGPVQGKYLLVDISPCHDMHAGQALGQVGVDLRELS